MFVRSFDCVLSLDGVFARPMASEMTRFREKCDMFHCSLASNKIWYRFNYYSFFW